MSEKQSEMEKSGRSTEGNTLNAKWNILDVLIIVAQGYRFIVLCVLATAIVTTIISLCLPSRYTAEASLLPPKQSSISSSMLSQLSGQGLAALAGASLGATNQNETYTAMFRSQTVEDAMIKRFDLLTLYRVNKLSDARKIFEKRSTAVSGLKDGIIRVTVEGPSPGQAALMTNAYVEEFQKLASGVATTEAGQRRLFFDQQLEETKNHLADAEQDLKKTELTTGMVQPDSQSRAMIESAAAIQAQIAVKEVQIRALLSSETKENPDVIVAEQQLDTLRSQLAQFTGNTSSESNLFVPKGKVPAAALDYVRKLREVKYQETIFQALASQFELAKLDEAKQGAVFQVIDPAIPPDKRSYPQRVLLVLITSTLAFLLASIFIWVRAALRALEIDPESGPKVAALLAELRWRKS